MLKEILVNILDNQICLMILKMTIPNALNIYREIMETVMNKLMDDYRDVIDQAISDQSEDKKTVIRDRFLASYKANLEVGLAAVFGKEKEVKSLPPPATEVGVDDLIRKGQKKLRSNELMLNLFPPATFLPRY